MSNVFLTGGNMQHPGMKERVERELLALRPFQSHFKVNISKCLFKNNANHVVTHNTDFDEQNCFELKLGDKKKVSVYRNNIILPAYTGNHGNPARLGRVVRSAGLGVGASSRSRSRRLD